MGRWQRRHIGGTDCSKDACGYIFLKGFYWEFRTWPAHTCLNVLTAEQQQNMKRQVVMQVSLMVLAGAGVALTSPPGHNYTPA